jgi:hypothetical protein
MSNGFVLPPGAPPGTPRGIPNNRLAPWLVPLAILWIVLLARTYGGTGTKRVPYSTFLQYLERAMQILSSNRAALEDGAQRLLAQETLTRDQLPVVVMPKEPRPAAA